MDFDEAPWWFWVLVGLVFLAVTFGSPITAYYLGFA